MYRNPTPFLQLCPTLMIHPSLQEYTPLLNMCDPSRIYPPPFKHLYATLPESTLPPRIDTPLFDNYMRPSHNIPLPPRIYRSFI